MNKWFLLLIYWIISFVIVHIVRRKRNKRTGIQERLSVMKHLAIALLCPLGIPYYLISISSQYYLHFKYKNRPRPIPKKLRKFLNENCVIDENNRAISLEEYNKTHNTNFTLRDVYGKG